jgi:hypothetical protein
VSGEWESETPAERSRRGTVCRDQQIIRPRPQSPRPAVRWLWMNPSGGTERDQWHGGGLPGKPSFDYVVARVKFASLTKYEGWLVTNELSPQGLENWRLAALNPSYPSRVVVYQRAAKGDLPCRPRKLGTFLRTPLVDWTARSNTPGSMKKPWRSSNIPRPFCRSRCRCGWTTGPRGSSRGTGCVTTTPAGRRREGFATIPT